MIIYWRDATINRHAEIFAGGDGHYTRVAEESMPKVYDNEGDRLADNGAFVITLNDGHNYAFNVEDHEFYYTNYPVTHETNDLGGLLADIQLFTVYGSSDSAKFPHVVYDGKAIYANREIQEPGIYDSIIISANLNVKDSILDERNKQDYSYSISKKWVDTDIALRYADSLTYNDLQKYGKTVLADQTRYTALAGVGSVGGAEVAKYLTPKYTGPYMRGH